MIEAMTVATSAPINTVMAGVKIAISLWIVFRRRGPARRQDGSASCQSARSPRPSAGKLIAIGGKELVAASGPDNPPPSFKPETTRPTACRHIGVDQRALGDAKGRRQRHAAVHEASQCAGQGARFQHS